MNYVDWHGLLVTGDVPPRTRHKQGGLHYAAARGEDRRSRAHAVACRGNKWMAGLLALTTQGLRVFIVMAQSSAGRDHPSVIMKICVELPHVLTLAC